MASNKSGFTLIELMIVIVIIGILAMIAIPSYRNYLVQSRRGDGQAALLDLANRLEHYYADNGTYATATIASGSGATDVLASNLSPEQWYSLTITAQDIATYTLQATPNHAQANEDTICQTFTLDNFGQKGITAGPAGAPTGSIASCWI